MDYSNWLTKQQAAEALDCSPKTVEQLHKAGKLQRGERRHPTSGQRLVVYHPAEVAAMVQERHGGAAAAFLVPDQAANGNGHGAALALTRPSTPEADPLRALATLFIDAWSEAQKGEKAQKAEKLFLTLPEAADASGFSQAYLRRKCQAGWSGAIKDVAWKIRRKDLEQL